MSFNVEARKLQLENLEQFISSAKDKIQGVLNTLGWNAENVLQDNQFITCSLDPNHKVPQQTVHNHIKNCALRKEGYNISEQFLSEPQQGASSIHIDDHKKIEILSAAHKSIENFRSDIAIDKIVLMPQCWNGQDPDPKTSDRLTSTFSTDERLAIYNYAITNTNGPSKLPEFDIFSADSKRNNDKPLTYEEKLALERDLKRRKIKYKSVHTSHKDHTEVLREVIEAQMTLYKDWLDNTNDKNLHTKELETIKFDLERNRSNTTSRNSNTSDSSRSIQRKSNDKYDEQINDSRSTSRRTSLDRESSKSVGDSYRDGKRRSRSYDTHRKRKNDYGKYGRTSHYHSHKDRSPGDRYKHERYLAKSSTDRRSRDRRNNGYKSYRN